MKSLRAHRAVHAARMGEKFTDEIVWPVLMFMAALGMRVAILLGFAATLHAQTACLGDGFSPSSMNTGNLPPSQTIYYDTSFLKNLKAETVHVRCTDRKHNIPKNSGNQIKLYMYQPVGANTTQAGEGVVGSGITITVLSNLTTIGQYADYINFSDLALETAIDPTLENTGREMAYRLGQTLSTLVMRTADGAYLIDPLARVQLPANTPFTKSNIIEAIQGLAGVNAKPFDRGKFCGVVHPHVTGDVVNDVTNNSASDILKHTIEGQMKLEELPNVEGDEVQVLDWGGATFYQSTLVTNTPNYLGSGSTGLSTYLYGEEGVLSINLGGTRGTGDGRWQNLEMITNRWKTGSPSDPVNMIGGSTGYNVKFATTLPCDLTMRVRVYQSVSAIA